jgi:hypothetical protein
MATATMPAQRDDQRSRLLSEDILSIGEAGRLIGRDKKTVWRWTQHGLRAGNGGNAIKLESTEIGYQLMTSKQALVRFAQATGIRIEGQGL